MIERFRNGIMAGLLCGVILTMILVGLRLFFFIDRVGTAVENLDFEVRAVSQEARITLSWAQGLLESARGSLQVIRRAAIAQEGHYEALGRRSATAAAKLTLLIDHADARMERITQAVENSSERANAAVDQYGTLATDTDSAVRGLTTMTGGLIQASAETIGMVQGTIEHLNKHMDDQRLSEAINGLAEASKNLDRGTAAAADTMEHLRDATSPKKRSFWTWILGLLIPRPTIGIKK